jgi:spore germination protein KA
MIGTTIRWLRFFSLFITLFLPSLYVAVITYHQEMIPTKLLISMAAAREQVPFPALIEALIMEVTFEVLREAGIRLPRQIGTALSIVGALVIGEAAVFAGLVSQPMVIVVALTGIASFTIPYYGGIAIRLLRFPIILSAGMLGFLGIMLGSILTILHLSSLRSFGLPYLTPLAPSKPQDMKDVLFRAPLWALNTRPNLASEVINHRQAPVQKPNSKDKDEV